MSDALRTIGISKKFRRITVLNDLNLAVPEESVYGLVGPNGAGKSTTIKILMNLISPSSGRSEVLGNDSRKLSGRSFAEIAYVSEDQQMPEWMTVGYLLDYLRPFYPKWDSAREHELLRQFDLPRDRKLKHLSRGMRMKAALASSLAYHPRLIVLDEPFTGLDPLVRDEFIEGLLENAEGATIFVSSHDLAEIETFASHIGYLEQGRLQFSEEMSSLTERFRQIEVRLTTTPSTVTDWPASWLNPEETSTFARFIDSSFERERTFADIQRVFGSVTDVDVKAMPLRSIFVTQARAGRKAE